MTDQAQNPFMKALTDELLGIVKIMAVISRAEDGEGELPEQTQMELAEICREHGFDYQALHADFCRRGLAEWATKRKDLVARIDRLKAVQGRGISEG